MSAPTRTKVRPTCSSGPGAAGPRPRSSTPKLTASDGAAEDFFGWSVAISDDTILVGALADGPPVNRGSAYVFVEPVGGWVGSLNEEAKLTPSDGAFGDFFGNSVGASGDTVVVASAKDQGSVYVFAKPAAGWGGSLTETLKLLTAPLTTSSNTAVAISGETVVAGAPGYSTPNINQGAAYVYDLTPATATLAGFASICAGGSKLIGATLTGVAPWTLVWSDGFTQTNVTASPALRSVSPATTTVYTVTTVTGANGATSAGTGSTTVFVFPLPTATVSGNATIQLGGSALISAALTGTPDWALTWSDGFQQTASTSPATRLVTPSVTTVYTVTSVVDRVSPFPTDDPACPNSGTGSATITVIPPASTVVFKNLIQTADGQSLLTIDQNNHLIVSNIGASGGDGVSVAVTGDRFTTDFLEPAFPATGSATWKGIVRGMVGGAPTEVCSVSMTGTSASVNVLASFTGASQVRVNLFRQGLLVGTYIAPSTSPVGAVGPCAIRFAVALVEDELSGAGPCMIVGLEHVESFTGFDSNVYQVDEIHIERANGTTSVQSLVTTSLRAANIPSFTITEEALLYPAATPVTFFNRSQVPLGHTFLSDGGSGRLVASNLGSHLLAGDPNGLRITVDDGVGALESVMTAEFDPFDLPTSGAGSVQAKATGQVEGSPATLAQVGLSGSNNLFNLSADFSGLGATTVRVELFRQGQLVGSFLNPNGEVGGTQPCLLVGSTAVRLTRVSANVEEVGGTQPCMIVGVRELVDFTPGPGATLLSGLGSRAALTALPTFLGIDEIHVEAVDPTKIFQRFSKLDVEADGMSSFRVTNEIPALPPVTANAGPDQEICFGSSVVLGGSPTGQGGMPPRTYLWSPSTGLSSPTSPNPIASPAVTTTYTVLVTAETGGSASDQVLVRVNPRPVANAGPDKIAAFGQTVTLGGAPTASGGTPGYSYLWSPAAGLSSQSVSNPTAILTPAGATSATYTVTVTDSKGCTATDQVVVTAYGFVFVSNGLVKVDQNQDSKGDVHAGGTIEFKKGAPGTHVGNLQAKGNVTIDTKNTIVGNVTSGGSITLASGSTITGTRTQNASVPSLPLPSLSYSASGQNVTVPSNGTRVLAPGSYGTVKVGTKGTLFLSPGDYFMKTLDTDESAVLSINASGSVNVYVVTELEFEKSVSVKLTAGTSGKVLFASKQENKVQVGTNAVIYGNLIVPGAEVHFNTGSKIKGAVLAKSITLDAKVKFYSHTATGF